MSRSAQRPQSGIDDLRNQGYWQQVEAYLGEHSEIEFSHGLCPECVGKLYPDLGKADT